MSVRRVVIVGAGHAGVHLALELRRKAFDGSIVLVNDEPDHPYQRPPLSKTKKAEAERLPFRPESFFVEHEIALRTNCRATAIDRSAMLVRTADGADLPYDVLVLATGARNRPAPFDTKGAEGVLALRTFEEARVLHARIRQAHRLAIVGAGFIGLELAAVASAAGCSVDLVEQAPHALGRAVSRPMSEALTRRLKEKRVRFHFGRRVESLAVSGQEMRLALPDSSTIEADTVLVAIGAEPDTELARTAGLSVDGGIVVDHQLRTDDPAIFAIGDCAAFPGAGHQPRRMRLESVQNAHDQGRFLAGFLTGAQEPYSAVPWFWSDVGDSKLQIAGLALPDDVAVLRGDPEADRFAVARLREGRLVALETLNMPGEHLQARRLLAGAPRMDREVLEDPARKLADAITDMEVETR